MNSAVKMQWRSRIAIALTLALAGAGLSTSAVAQAPLIPVRAAFPPVVTWLPSWVAKEKGFFAKHGLDVTLTITQNLSLLPGTMGKQFDFGASTPTDLLKAVASGIDVVDRKSTRLNSSH